MTNENDEVVEEEVEEDIEENIEEEQADPEDVPMATLAELQGENIKGLDADGVPVLLPIGPDGESRKVVVKRIPMADDMADIRKTQSYRSKIEEGDYGSLGRADAQFGAERIVKRIVKPELGDLQRDRLINRIVDSFDVNIIQTINEKIDEALAIGDVSNKIEEATDFFGEAQSQNAP